MGAEMPTQIYNGNAVNEKYGGTHVVVHNNKSSCLTIVNASQQNAGVYLSQDADGDMSVTMELEVFG